MSKKSCRIKLTEEYLSLLTDKKVQQLMSISTKAVLED
ncbi:hypothetical protein C427_2789 [Paraglaciecola psychrophila 170]|uniref:Uncharacterized protein n=1 Tax=Paraglaciecola psychrophila 170 TaxID=1129794 RepID=K7ALE0_9ALTE|nr:hypothetical protein C427_2789 [Paraglaciecola psychrophila 170]GAC36255.1 hypothetical protein GPSY_0617 [Paraglaciecola psychrophila 170]